MAKINQCPSKNRLVFVKSLLSTFALSVAVVATPGLASAQTDCHRTGNCTKHPLVSNDAKTIKGTTAENAVCEYYFTLLSQILYESPVRYQQWIKDVGQSHYDFLENMPGAKSYQDVMNETNQLMAQLKTLFHTVSVDWNSGANTQTGNLSAIALATGLTRHVFVDVKNQTTQSMNYWLFFDGSYPPVPVVVTVQPGETKTFLAALKSDNSSATQATLRIVPNGDTNQTRVMSIPITVSAPATLRGTVYDLDDVVLSPAKMWVNGPDGMLRVGGEFASNSTLTEKQLVNYWVRMRNERLPFFYTDGTFEVQVPPGQVEVSLERGYEHPIINSVYTLAPGEVRDISLSSSRHINMKTQGWYSGDTHVHWVKNWWDENEDMTLLDMVMRAEDLRVVNNQTLFQYRDAASGGNFVKPDQYPAGPAPGYSGGSDYHVEMGEEFRNDMMYGHINLMGLDGLIYPIATGQGSGGPVGTLDYPTNKTIITQTHQQGGIVTDAHGMGPMNSSYVSPNVVHGLVDGVDQLAPVDYYRFLNSGFQIPLTNGSDHPARTAGKVRTYVKTDLPYSYDKWIDGIRHDRTFVSSGPLVFLEVNGAGIGDELNVASGAGLTITASAWSRYPLGNFQVICNGNVIYSTNTTNLEASATINHTVTEGSWFVVRCSQTNEYNALLRDNVAHSSPVYVNVNGKHAYVQNDVQTLINLMSFQASYMWDYGSFADDTQRSEAVNYILDAVTVCQDIISNGGLDAPGVPSSSLDPQITLDSVYTGVSQTITGFGADGNCPVELFKNGQSVGIVQSAWNGTFAFYGVDVSSSDSFQVSQQDSWYFDGGSSDFGGWFSTNTGGSLSITNDAARFVINDSNAYAAIGHTSLGRDGNGNPAAGTGHPASALRVLEFRLKNPGTASTLYVGTNDAITGPPYSYLPVPIVANSNVYQTYQIPLTNHPAGALPDSSTNFWLLLLPSGATNGDVLDFDYIRVREYLDYHFDTDNDLMWWFPLNGFSGGLSVSGGYLNATAGYGLNRIAMYQPPCNFDTDYFSTVEIRSVNTGSSMFRDVFEWLDMGGTGLGAVAPNASMNWYQPDFLGNLLVHDLANGVNGSTWGRNNPTSNTFIYTPGEGATLNDAVSIDYIRVRPNLHHGPSYMVHADTKSSVDDWMFF